MTAEKKKRRRRSTFATALAQAKSRLQKAQQELEAAQKLVADLNIEIPLLRHTAEALERQIAPPVPTLRAARPEEDPCGVRPHSGPFGEHLISTAPTSTLTEEDTLPEPEGQELVPES